MINYKRLIISTITGALLGIICIIGVGSRLFAGDYLGNIVYLLGIWMSRLVLGVTIGFVGEFVIVPGISWKKWINVSIRGIFFGLLFSTTVLLIDPYFNFMTFGAGITYGLIIDLVATFLTGEKAAKLFTRKKTEKEEKKD
ncbi:MAG: hypothetical protein KGD64_00995 [Candidatus Heimdallarchaeota archaeon]|nr:hypothetical protein [Candidatus Heimdallarchaeota archaeon]